MIALPPALFAQSHDAARPSLAGTAKQMEGILWYQMLSELNKNGLDTNSLGAGGDAFQGMFLWDVAQHDFGKYDDSLTAAALRQIGGSAHVAPGAAASGAAASGTAASSTAALGTAALGTAMSVATGLARSSPVNAALPPGAQVRQSPAALVDQAKKFARAVWPAVQAAAAQLGVPAVGVLAQTALETGWGAAAGGNNLFGIKAADGQSGTARDTQEMVDGVLVAKVATFRDYPSASASVSDYVGTIQSGFQNVVGQGDIGGFAQALQNSGYATDSQYAAKLISISQSPLMAAVLSDLGGAYQPGS